MAKPALSRQRGLTLIELLVTLTVLVIILFFSVPLFTTWNQNTRVRSAAESLQNAVRLAQSTAVSTNGDVVLRLTTDDVPGADSDRANNGLNWVLLDTADNVFQVKGDEAFGDVTMTPPEDFEGEITFLRLGQNDLVETAAFEFTAIGADKTLRVLVTPGGRVRMCDPDRGSDDPQGCDEEE
jgi:type IV fimbrial biogenesis protein FimT